MIDTQITTTLRHQPIQTRSATTLSSMLLSAAKVVHAVGTERLTSELVAVGSGFSIGTVYRYFEDRLNIIDALGKSNLERFRTECLNGISPRRYPGWFDAFAGVLDYLELQFATQPGFRSVRFGDHLDGRVRAREQTNIAIAALSLQMTLEDNYPSIIDTGIVNRIEVALVLHDAMLGHAFAHSDAGDARLIANARKIAIDYLTPTPAP